MRQAWNRYRWLWIISGLAVTWALREAIRLRWVTDDAFISFRYARNFIRGHGLVFNVEEKVEGFTNFLWTLLMAPGIALGIDPGVWSILFSILAMVSLFGALLFFLYSSAESRIPVTWPAMMIAILAGHHHFQVFATSGLETMAFSVFAFLGLYLAIVQSQMEGAHSFKWQVAGLWLLTLACLTRPDGVLYLALTYLFLLWNGSILLHGTTVVHQTAGAPGFTGPGQTWTMLRQVFSGLRKVQTRLLQYLAPGLLLVVYQGWRLYYYDSWFPNTFYAKSAYDPYPGQGFVYVFLFYSAYWYLPVLLAGSLFIAVRSGVMKGWPVILLAAALWHSYVIWVGGDFMFGRFMMPVLPLVAFLIAVPIAGEVQKLPDRFHPGALAALALFLISFLRQDPYAELREAKEAPAIDGITEERLFYPRKDMARMIELADSLRPVIRQSRVRVAFRGAAAFQIYYMDPVYALESATGLTDRKLARQILDRRGRIGHEKEVTEQYLNERNVHLCMWPPEGKIARELQIEGLWQTWHIVNFDPTVFGPLEKHPFVTLLPPPD